VADTSIPSKRKIRLRGIALPNEHGSWGFLFEPLVAALAIAPSKASVWIALAAVGAFLMRQPLKILLSDLAEGRNLPQTAAALKFVIVYGAISLTGFTGSLLWAEPFVFLPFALIFPLAVYQIYCDFSRQARNLLPEMTGAAAISSTSAVIALAGGRTYLAAAALWTVFIVRLIPSILYVRNRLRLEKGKTYSVFPVVFWHVIAIGLVGLLAFSRLIPYLTLPVFAVLLGRAGWGLSPYRKRVKAMKIGIMEVIYGTLLVVAVILGYYFQI